MASGSSNNGNIIDKENRRAIIFYNYDDGSDVLAMTEDSKKLKDILNKLHFHVVDHCNLTEKKITQTLKEFCNGSKDASCLFVFVLTHGDGTELMAHDTENVTCENAATCTENDPCKGCAELKIYYPIEDLLKTISSVQEMAEIPKVVFIDACQGDELDRGFDSMDTTDGKSDQTQLPSNLLVACAATPGYQAFADNTGSLFIEQICNLLQEGDDFMSNLTVVNNKVSTLFRDMEGKDKRTVEAKQMPFIISNLTSKLYLTAPGHPEQKEYNMGSKKRLAIILNDINTDKNRVNYKELFEKLGSFTIKEYKMEDTLTQTLQTVVREYGNHTEYSCFVCCIAAKYSGEQPCILFPPYWKNDLNQFFTDNEFFAWKPKIFFMHLEGNGTQSIPDGYDDTDGKVSIPRTADILIYSVKENFSSEPNKHTTAAAKIISAQLESASESAQETKKDVVTALTEASQSIADKKMPTPTMFSTLTNKVFLKKLALQ